MSQGNARESYSHVLLSKSAARKRHVSSERRGYKPTVSLPKRWFSITASVSGMKLPRLPVDLLPLLRAASVDRLPIRHDAGMYPCRPSLFSHRERIHLLSRETGSETGDSLSGPLLLVHRRRYLNSFGRRRILWRKLRNRNAVNRQEPPQASVLLAKTNVLLLRRFEWKRVWTILAHGAFTASCEVPALLRNTSARRKHHSDTSREPAFLGESVKRDLPNPLAA